MAETVPRADPEAPEAPEAPGAPGALQGQQRAGIVWIASFQKSGNTWTRAFLHNLVLAMAGEDAEQNINSMGRFSTWECGINLYVDALGRTPTNADKAAIAAVRAAVQQRIADAHDDLVFVKTHLALAHDHGHPTINLAVTSGAIYIVRNPLDVAISYAHHMGCSLDAAIGALCESRAQSEVTVESVHEVFGSWSEHVASWTRRPHPAIHVLRYEDLLARPHEAFTGVVRHLRLGADPDQVRRAVERSAFDRLKAQEAQAGFTERRRPGQTFFREGRAGQWRDHLTPSQIDRLVDRHHEQMARFGYLP